MQQKSPLRAGKPTLRNARILTQNENRVSTDSSETGERGNDEYDRHTTYPGEEEDSTDVILQILAFNNSDEEDANDRPNITHAPRTTHN